MPSPDGEYVAHYDKDQQLWIYEIKAKTQAAFKVAPSAAWAFATLTRQGYTVNPF